MNLETILRRVTRSPENFKKEESERQALAVKTQYDRLLVEEEGAQNNLDHVNAFDKEAQRRVVENLRDVKKRINKFRQEHNIPEETQQ